MANIAGKKAKNLAHVVVEKVSVIEGSGATVDIKMAPTSRYKMVPVDQETHKRLMAVCRAYGFGQRGQGAMVRKLVNSEFEKISPIVPASNL